MLKDRYRTKTYQAGLKMILYVSVRELFKCDIYFLHSLDKGLYCEIKTSKELNNEDIEKIRLHMQEIISKNEKINKKIISKKDAYDFYLKINEKEKASLIQILNIAAIPIYELHGYYNNFLDMMPEYTGDINKFNLTFIDNKGLVLSFPITDDDNIPPYTDQELILKSFKDYRLWCASHKTNYISGLNDIISQSKIKEFIKMNDIMINNQIYNIANNIVAEKKKIVILGGPSSSGKTTSTRKLSLYLHALGANPIVLSVDDYFKEREDTPRLPNGKFDFESVDAIDLVLFNTQLQEMMSGKTVKIPTFNFETGKKEYSDKKTITIKENDIILIEGLHFLNEELSKNVPRKDKYKIYISPFMPLSFDRHNHISTIDIRLLRRIVRDNRTRGSNVLKTLESWEDVRNGETKYVFPYTNEADIILNTAYVYEIGILKVYAEPLLHSVPIDSKYYRDARRLIGGLQMFFPIPSEYISDDNILREFIGESYFE